MEGMVLVRRLWRWTPVVFWLGFIFILSSIPGVMLPHMEDFLSFLAHKTAHFIEYSVLGVLVIRTHIISGTKISFKIILSAIFFIFFAGLFDEWHQSFVPGRGPQFSDVMFDTVCGVAGILAYKFFWRLAKEINNSDRLDLPKVSA